jgi:DHA1 family bicyclomycin/chloramphenicol resistance-like MFS transporter
VLSKVMTVVSAASVVGPLLGAALVANAEWRICFLLLSIAGALLLACVAAFLHESIAARDPSALRPRRIVGNYRRFFATRISVSYAVVNACLYGGLLAYLSGSPFVLLSGVGQVGETAYGALLAITAIALICGAVVNGRLVQRHAPERMIMAGVQLLIVASACLVTTTAIISPTGAAAVISLVAPMSLYALGIGLIAPNTTAIGMAPLSDMAGGAASIMLSLQAIFGAAAGYLVSLGQDGTPRSIAVVTAVCGFAAAAVYLAGLQRELTEEAGGTVAARAVPETMAP